jgi:hypothetical protein
VGDALITQLTLQVEVVELDSAVVGVETLADLDVVGAADDVHHSLSLEGVSDDLDVLSENGAAAEVLVLGIAGHHIPELFLESGEVGLILEFQGIVG